MTALAHAQFLRAVGRTAELPPPGPPEVAFAGRSNVGKSSAINALTGRRALARVSKTPGRTQTINFYSIGDEARLVDLPGYGYARVPQSMRAQWRELVGAYLASARNVVGIVVIMDARHPLTPLDAQLIEWLASMENERPLHILLSKADKLSRSEQAQTLRDMQRRIGRHTATLFSSATKQGVDECRGLLEHWLETGRAEIKSPR